MALPLPGLLLCSLLTACSAGFVFPPDWDAVVGDAGPADGGAVDGEATDAAMDSGPGDGAIVDVGVDAHVPACGDGVVDPGEECDDGNLRSHDGCSSGCTDEVPTWTELSLVGGSPSGRYGHAMTYSTDGDEVLLHGGRDCCSYFADLWRFTGAGWTALSPSPAPSERAFHAMAHDEARGVSVLYAGDPFGTDLQDTWELDGVGWTQQMVGTNPGESSFHSLTYFAPVGGVLFYGPGTWGYDGSWTDLSPSADPGGRARHALTWDRGRNVVVLHGGTQSGTTQGDTWEYDGATWVETSPILSPAARAHHRLVYAPSRQCVVAFGGLDAGSDLLNDTWEYDGTAWTPLTTEGAPSARYGFDMVFDRAGDRLLLFGGALSYSSPIVADDTWMFRWESGWPDEVCATAGDEDGDGLADCADPDCELRPCGGGHCVGGSCQ